MHQRWDTKRIRERTIQLMGEQLFCDIYKTFKDITTEYNEPSPAELWDEAASRWKPFLASNRPNHYVEFLKEELTEEYGELSTFLVLIIMMYMLVAMFRPTKEDPYYPFCQALAEATKDHPLLQRVWVGVRQKEDEEERAGKKIGIVTSLLTGKEASEQVICLDTIEQQILRLPTFELQKKTLNQADDLLRGTSWGQRSAVVQDKMYALVNEQKDRQQNLEENMMKAANKPAMQVDVKAGAHVQITEKDITNQFPEIPKE